MLKAQRKATLQIPAQVPKDIEAGSYHSLLILGTTPHVKKKGKVSMNIIPQYGVQIISTIGGGINDFEVVKAEVIEDKLCLDIKNTGSNLLILRVHPDDSRIESRRVLIYPNQTQRTKLDCYELNNGKHRIRILLDNEKEFIKPKVIHFRKVFCHVLPNMKSRFPSSQHH